MRATNLPPSNGGCLRNGIKAQRDAGLASVQVAQPEPASALFGFGEEAQPKNEYERMLKCVE